MEFLNAIPLLHVAPVLVGLVGVWFAVKHLRLKTWYFVLFAIGPILELLSSVAQTIYFVTQKGAWKVSLDLMTQTLGGPFQSIIMMGAFGGFLTEWLSSLALLLIGLKARRGNASTSLAPGTI